MVIKVKVGKWRGNHYRKSCLCPEMHRMLNLSTSHNIELFAICKCLNMTSCLAESFVVRSGLGLGGILWSWDGFCNCPCLNKIKIILTHLSSMYFWTSYSIRHENDHWMGERLQSKLLILVVSLSAGNLSPWGSTACEIQRWNWKRFC